VDLSLTINSIMLYKLYKYYFLAMAFTTLHKFIILDKYMNLQ